MYHGKKEGGMARKKKMGGGKMRYSLKKGGGSKNPKLKGKAGGQGGPSGGTVKGAIKFAMNPKKAVAQEVVKRMMKKDGGYASAMQVQKPN